MINPDNLRQSMLSVPARWSEVYFDLFAIMCVFLETLVIYYGISSSRPDDSVLDIAASILLLLAAVPIVAALNAYLAMRGRDLALKTWETFKLERYNKGREDEREHIISEIRERLAQREASERGERDDWLDEILSDLSENGGGEKRRRPRD